MNQKILPALLLQISFVTLTIVTGILGGAPALLLSRTIGTLAFAILEVATVGIFIFIKAYLAAALLLCAALLVLVYQIFENRSLLFRGIAAVTLCTAILFLFLYFWTAQVLGVPLFDWIEKGVRVYLEQAKPFLGGVEVDVKSIVYQTPSIATAFFGVTLWLGVLFDSSFQRKRGFSDSQKEIRSFRTPDAFIWITIAALLFSFLKTTVPGLQEIALNILNITLLLYFFQGLSVLSFLMTALNFSALLKMVMYFIFVAQLLLPICLGFLDFWLNFRKKLSKNADGKL